jgi:hypothetical protein
MSNFSFLSWVQNPLVGRSVIRPTSLRPIVPVRLNLRVAGSDLVDDSVSEDIAIHGPGDVIGLQPEAVLKTTPPAGEQQYSPLLLPSIEFSEEDLPWRYSPPQEGATAEQKVPWCFLLTLKEDEFSALPQGTGPLPAIQITDLSMFPVPSAPATGTPTTGTWLWAHVQVNDAISSAPLLDASFSGRGPEAESRPGLLTHLEPPQTRTQYELPRVSYPHLRDGPPGRAGLAGGTHPHGADQLVERLR